MKLYIVIDLITDSKKKYHNRYFISIKLKKKDKYVGILILFKDL